MRWSTIRTTHRWGRTVWISNRTAALPGEMAVCHRGPPFSQSKGDSVPLQWAFCNIPYNKTPKPAHALAKDPQHRLIAQHQYKEKMICQVIAVSLKGLNSFSLQAGFCKLGWPQRVIEHFKRHDNKCPTFSPPSSYSTTRWRFAQSCLLGRFYPSWNRKKQRSYRESRQMP